MEELLRKLRKINRRLEEVEDEIHRVNILPFYSIWGTQQEKEKDLKTCNEAKNALLDAKYALMETIQLQSAKEMGMIAMEMKNQNKLKTA